MTAAAVGTKFAVMDIVGQVAVGTAVAGFAHRRQRATVATPAGDIDMCTMQFKVGLRIVIEQPQVPCDRVVTGFAIALVDAMVVVVLEVAVDTAAAGINKYLRGMALTALDIGVLAEQREALVAGAMGAIKEPWSGTEDPASAGVAWDSCWMSCVTTSSI